MKKNATIAAPASIGTRLFAFLMSFVLVLGLCPAIALAEGESNSSLLYYLKGTDWNMGTTDDWVLDPDNEVERHDGEKYLANTTAITDYVDGMDIYVRPKAALRFSAGPVWTDAVGCGWSKINADSGMLQVDSDGDGDYEWEWSVTKEAADKGRNIVLINDTGSYEEFAITIRIKNDAGDEENIKMNIHVVPYNDVATLSSVLEDQHEKNNQYDNLSIKTLPVTLYNYEGKTFNDAYGADGYLFVNDTAGKTSVNTSGLNSGTAAVKMGILENDLSSEGLPVLRSDLDVTGSVDVMSALFSSSIASGKTVYDGVDFQFVYDSDTQYYTYSSMLNHAQLNEAKDTVEIYRQSMGVQETNTTSVGAEGTRGGFYPFTDIREAFLNSNASTVASNTDLSSWADMLKHAYSTGTDYTAQLVKDLCYTSGGSSTIDMHFGMQLEAYFYLPESKATGGADGSSGEPLVFEFTGDDDMWVFIDGKLVLDVGGPHAARTGKIDFQTGEVTVDLVSKLTGPNTVDDAEGCAYRTTSETLLNLETDEIHKMQIFYLERYSGVSNCYMRFNIPIIPSNTVSISKSVADTDVNPTSVALPTTFEFKLMVDEPLSGAVDPVERAYTGPYIVSGAEYETDAEGVFKLGEGETAMFEGIPSNSRIKVVEKGPEGNFHYVGMKVTEDSTVTQWEYSGESDFEGVIQNEVSTDYVTTDDEGGEIDILNIIEVAPLTIEKTFSNKWKDVQHEDDEFEMILKFYSESESVPTPFSGNATKYAADDTNLGTIKIENGSFSLKVGEKIVIEKVPVNMTGVIQEVGVEAGSSSGLYGDPVISGCGIDPAIVLFGTDSKDFVISESGGGNVVTVKNSYAIGDLTIIKEGLEEPVPASAQPESIVDSDASKTAAAGESALFLIEGGDFSKEIVVAGNGAVTIKDLQVGIYKVTELAGWTWGYGLDCVYDATDSENPALLEPVQGDVYEIEVTPSGAVIKFVNKGDEKWLHDDCWCKNVFERVVSSISTAGN